MERFIEHSPVTVMARLALQRAIEPQWLDDLFEQHGQRQYTRELLFSTTVELMSLVAVGLRPSVHAAAKTARELPVSITALYDKINRTQPALVRALVAGSAQRLAPLLQELRAEHAQPRWRLRVVDGSHLRATHKRLAALRGFRGAALPGQSLVVYEPDTALVVDMLPCEDAHLQERVLMQELVHSAQPGELWIADRNFCTRALLRAWHERGSAFIVREHAANARPKELEPAQPRGRCDSGRLAEQRVSLPLESDSDWELRRIELELDEPTEDGDTLVRLLCNASVQELSTHDIAQLYRKRWGVEALFQRLESVLQSEIASLGHPRAALLAFGVAALAYNVLAVLQQAVAAAEPDSAVQPEDVSPYFLAQEIKAHYAGMLLATTASAWQELDALAARPLARLLLDIASHVEVRRLRRHPRAPKEKTRKGYVPASVVHRHVSTARVLAKGSIE